MTTVGEGVAVGFVVVGGVVVVEDSVAVDGERAEVDDVVDVVDTIGDAIEVVPSTAVAEESDAVSGSDAELGGLVSLLGRLGDVNVGSDTVLSVLDDSDNDVAAKSAGSIVGLDTVEPSSGTWNGAPVPSQYKLTALGPPHTWDTSPVHAMLHKSSDICCARPFNRLPQKHSPEYSVPATL